ncbi:MAG TPA: hypothetical protein VFZ43_12505 [Anaerolineales bacterium]
MILPKLVISGLDAWVDSLPIVQPATDVYIPASVDITAMRSSRVSIYTRS